MDKFFSLFGKVVLVLIGAGVILGSGYYLGQVRKSHNAAHTSPISQMTQKTLVSPTHSVTPTSSDTTHFAVSAGGVNPFVAYTLSGISGWTLAKQHVDLSDKVTLTQGQYQLTIYQAAIGGGGCVFPGEQGSQMSIALTSPIDIPLLSGQPLRRGTAESANANQASYTICQKTSDGSYGSLTTFGAISYTTPLKPDPHILSQMDAMVGSLQKK